jgi:hypothetical protein
VVVTKREVEEMFTSADEATTSTPLLALSTPSFLSDPSFIYCFFDPSHRRMIHPPSAWCLMVSYMVSHGVDGRMITAR